MACGCTRGASWAQLRARREVELRAQHSQSASNSRSKVCVKYAGPMELWNDALVTPCEGQSRRRLSPLRLSANTAMLRTACFLCVIGHRELLPIRAGYGTPLIT